MQLPASTPSALARSSSCVRPATPSLTASAAIFGTFTDVSLKDIAKPIKPETMPLGTHTTNLWMTSRPRIHKGMKAGLAVSR